MFSAERGDVQLPYVMAGIKITADKNINEACMRRSCRDIIIILDFCFYCKLIFIEH